MVRQYRHFPLGPFKDGINRFVTEATPQQVADATNVTHDRGDTRPRRGFSSIAQAAMHVLPAGACYLILSDQTDSFFTDRADRDGIISSASSASRFYIGCTSQFNAILLQHLVISGTSTNARIMLVPAYYSTAAADFTDMNWHMDTTLASVAAAGVDVPFGREGVLSFYLSATELADWPTSTVNSIAGYYWTRWDLTDSAGAAATIEHVVDVEAPGIRCGELLPVGGILPFRGHGGYGEYLIGSDRLSRRGQEERGAMLGQWTGAGMTHELNLIQNNDQEDDGPGIYDIVTSAQWSGVGTYNLGAGPNQLRRNQLLNSQGDSYSWFFEAGAAEPLRTQFRGAVIAESIVAQAGSTALAIFLAASYRDAGSTIDDSDFRFEHCRVRCTTGGGGGPAAGEERECWFSEDDATNPIVRVYPAFSAAPVGASRFAIFRPHSHCLIGTDDWRRKYEIVDNDADDLTFSTAVYAAEEASQLQLGGESANTGRHVRFECGRSLRWVMRGGRRWSMVVDPDTQSALMTNGETGLLRWDGRRLLKDRANTDSPLANYLFGQLVDGLRVKDPRLLNQAKGMTEPPHGRFLVDYLGHIVVAGIHGRERDVVWSFPAAANNVWPLLYRQVVRDTENDPISGMATLGDRLVVFTPSAIHMGGPPNDLGQLAIHPVSQGIGFASHWGVTPVVHRGQTVLMGVNADGVYALGLGSQPEPVLQRWDQIVQNGVNVERLDQAVIVNNQQEKRVYIALAAFDEDDNRTVLEFDYQNGVWWKHEHPIGITAMVRDIQPSGRERTLFGAVNGHIQILREQDDDDGAAFASDFFTTPVRPGRERQLSFIDVSVFARNDAAADAVTLDAYLDESGTSLLTNPVNAEVYPGTGPGEWNADNWDTPNWGDQQMIEARVPLPSASRRGYSFQARVQLAGYRARVREIHVGARALGTARGKRRKDS